MQNKKKAPHGRPDLINYKLFATVTVTASIVTPLAVTF